MKTVPLEQTKKNLIKAIRSNVRLAHSLKAGNVLNDMVASAEAAYDKAVQSGGGRDAALADLTGVLEQVLENVLVEVKREQRRASERKALRA